MVPQAQKIALKLWVVVGGPCDYCVTPVPIGLGFGFGFGFGFGSKGTGLGTRA